MELFRPSASSTAPLRITSRPMRVLLPCAAYPPHGKGGGPASSRLLARGLTERGHAVRVITNADTDDLYQDDGVEVRTLTSNNVYWNYWAKQPAAAKVAWHLLENFNPRALLRMRREISDFKPDVVCTVSIENINVATWYASRLERVPVAHALHSYFLMCWRGTLFHGAQNCTDRCSSCSILSTGKKALTAYVDGVTGESAAILDRHIDAGYFKHAISEVVPGALERLPEIPAPRASDGPLRVGFIGLHSHNKGVETLAHAARALKGHDVEFLIAGDGDPAYTDTLRKAFPQKGTRFLGWAKPDEFFRQVDVNVVPSLWAEPFGRVSVESQSFGVPALVARSGGLPANIREGVTGFSFAPGDHDDLAGLLLRLDGDRDLLRRMSLNAHEYAQRFSITNIAEEFEKFLERTRRHAQRHHTS
jgi:glycosyltransferase involved in cell wall biosynthesis